MKNIVSIEDLKYLVKNWRNSNKTIGFVPTMGFLHEGHLSLMRRARSENDIVVTSVYVNPTQFGVNEDLASYPRDPKRDTILMQEVGVDACFFPTDDMMYPNGFQTYIETQGPIVKGLCGAKREGHFKGVTTIVGKLFNLVKPTKAYFGMKDAQQVAVIKRMVNDLNFDVIIVPCPIVRETDGLAMSSRNKYLKGEARYQAIALKRSLDLAKVQIEAGQRDTTTLITTIQENIESYNLTKIDYIEIVSLNDLTPITTLTGDVLIALAVFVEGTRLIDNLYLEV